MPTAIKTPRNPIHPSVLPRLNKQYEHMADAPMIQELEWDPSVRTKPAVPGGAALTRSIDLGDFSIRVFRPPSNDEQPLPVFIWYHGGGMVLGGIGAENAFCTRVVHAAQCVTIAVDYRMAPEYKFPTGHEDAWTESYKSWGVNRYCPGLPREKMEWYRDQYLPDAGDRADPLASPIFASDEAFKSSVDKVYIALAELDLLRSEGEAYAAKLQSFGKDVQCKTYPGVPHAIQAMDGVIDLARQWIKDMCTYVAVQFGKHPADVLMAIEGGGPWLKLDTPMVLGEAPFYRAEDSTLHYVDCLKEPAELHVLKLDSAGEAVGKPIIHQLEESVTVAFFRESKPGYICAYFAGVAFMDENGKLEVVKEIIPQEDRAIRRFNDGGVDCRGRFWLAEIDRKALSMGMGRLPEGYKPIVYLNDSAAGLVWAYDFDIASGGIDNRRLFIDRRELGGEPDGMVVDIEGNLWIAMWASHRVMCFSPTGEHLKDIKFTAKNMACTSWGGSDYDTLYIASASDRSPKRQPGDEGGHLFKYHVGVKGLPKYKFSG
ncbi:hypothetical protein IAU60_004894 [Kwoniella sp. DSM 27419]